MLKALALALVFVGAPLVALAGSPTTIYNSANTVAATVDSNGLHVVCTSGCSGGAPGAATPVVGNATAIVTGGTALNIITGPINGCYITNPLSAADENIATAENAYLNPVTTATTAGRGSTVTLAPGQSYNCVPGQTTNLSFVAATTAHALTVVKW